MERVVRLLALVALLSLLVVGCGKDTVSNPGGGTGVAAQDSTDGGDAGTATDTGTAAETGGTEIAGGAGSTSIAAGDGEPSGETAASSGGSGEIPKAGPGEVVLRYDLKKGQKYSYELKTVMNMMGQSVTVVTDFVASVLDVKGDKFLVEYKFGEAKVTASDPQMKSLIEQQMAAMKGTTVTADIDRRGQMTNAKGAGAQMLQGLGGASAFGFVFPEKALKVGESWTHTMDLPGVAGNQPLKMNFKLTGVDRNVATLTGSGTHTMEMSPPSGQQQGGTMTAKSTFSTTTKVDVATGMITESSGTFTTTMSGGGMDAPPQTTIVTIKRK